MTQVTSSTPADSEPCMCGSTTLVTLVSRTCMTVTSMAESVMSHFCAPEKSPAAAAVMLEDSEGGFAPLPNLPPEVAAPAKPALEADHQLRVGCFIDPSPPSGERAAVRAEPLDEPQARRASRRGLNQ